MQVKLRLQKKPLNISIGAHRERPREDDEVSARVHERFERPEHCKYFLTISLLSSNLRCLQYGH